ncbi:triacylglycerol lipase [Vitiosangium sp. GDMCC 1.1324]|uniref:esterase/lipase family protein n=1 Tax=Vitiosangium sp. (strain GDMCC 1.1324) TaxID=2138576 RepID=UPI000D384766|nr:alpha/beta fold hydrolase [Vitiosangium sp. GDMCC 1.1324]PTL81689.1 lipase [Vitiosangium sp. GDMCC 1.1324]
MPSLLREPAPRVRPAPGALVLALLAVVTGCATTPEARTPPPEHVPVLFVHGTDDTAGSFFAMRDAFEDAGWPKERLHAVRLHPNNGQVPIEAVAYQIRRAAEGLRKRTGAERIDVVAFSQGTLSSRYWMQELGGQPHVRRFISISGPHHGTSAANLRSDPALVQMRPDSDFLRELNRRENPFGDTEVFSFWTPLDSTIVPANSSHLPGATERTFLVLAHPLMLSSPAVISATVETLAKPSGP